MAHAPFIEVPEALRQFASGKMIIVVDDEDRENEGDLTMAAEFVTPEAINFMATFGRGLICLTLTEQRADQLQLMPMAKENTSPFQTAFTESIEAREGVTTGISAADRAHTILTAVNPDRTAADLARPGHVFPLRARDGGVLTRAGQTEAAVDLARMSGLNASGVICEVLNEDGTMARVPDLIEFCIRHDMSMLTVAELIRYRLRNERYVHRIAKTALTTPWGEFNAIAYESDVHGHESHLAITMGDLSSSDSPVLVRAHTHCLAGGIFCQGSCDCQQAVQQALRSIADEGRGALIYLHNGTRGFEVDRAFDPPRMVLRHASVRSSPDDRKVVRQSGIGAQILSDLGVHRIRLLVNKPTSVPALQGFGIEIVEQIPMEY